MRSPFITAAVLALMAGTAAAADAGIHVGDNLRDLLQTQAAEPEQGPRMHGDILGLGGRARTGSGGAVGKLDPPTEEQAIARLCAAQPQLGACIMKPTDAEQEADRAGRMAGGVTHSFTPQGAECADHPPAGGCPAQPEQKPDDPLSRARELLSISPLRLGGPMRDCLQQIHAIRAGQNPGNIDIIERCEVPDELVPSAVALLGGAIDRNGRGTPWMEAHCLPRYVGYECTYRGVSVDFR
jgi:hypothetical protein